MGNLFLRRTIPINTNVQKLKVKVQPVTYQFLTAQEYPKNNPCTTLISRKPFYHWKMQNLKLFMMIDELLESESNLKNLTFNSFFRHVQAEMVRLWQNTLYRWP